MLDAPPQPESGIKPVPADDGASKTDASLNDNACFLSVYRNRPAVTRSGEPSAEGLAEQRRLAYEMVSEAVATARVPEVASDKSMAAFWTTPECWCTLGQENLRAVRLTDRA
jgi:hypothetical protein